VKLEPPVIAMLVAIAVTVALAIWDAVRGVTSRLTDREQILRQMSNNGIGLIVLCLGLWFSLPSTPVLSTFGLPKTAADVASPERVLRYLQDYNAAIVRLTDTLFWLLFTCVFWVGWSFTTGLRRAARAPVGEAGAQNPTGAA